jgi:hypothetical protein
MPARYSITNQRPLSWSMYLELLLERGAVGPKNDPRLTGVEGNVVKSILS